MNSQQPFGGYPGQLWTTCWQSMAWLSELMNGGSTDTSVLDSPVEAVLLTLQNSLTALSAWQTAAVLNLEVMNLAAVTALPIAITPTDTAYVNARISSTAAAADGIASLVPAVSPFRAITLLSAGQPAVAYPSFIEYCMAFTDETPPAGLSSSTLLADATAAATAWLDTANAIIVLTGSTNQPAYDTAVRMYRCAATISNNLNQIQNSAFSLTNTLTLWNSAVALPSILLDAGGLYSPPSTLTAQQIGVIRYVLRYISTQLAVFLIILRGGGKVTQPSTAFLQNTQTLQDLAALTGGNFENWTEIAALNSLSPPYPGPTNPSQALAGIPLFLPSSQLVPKSNQTAPTYAANVLGTDFDWGPINGPQPTWLGDIPLITGYLNFSRAIGRRLQTSLGSLIYHTSYGSRIPPEVGAVQDESEAARLVAYGTAAISSDPRTGRIVSATGSVQPGFLATFSATVQPIGPGSVPISVNETIGPAVT